MGLLDNILSDWMGVLTLLMLAVVIGLPLFVYAMVRGNMR